MSDPEQIRIDDIDAELLCLIQCRPEHEKLQPNVEGLAKPREAVPDMLRCLSADGCMQPDDLFNETKDTLY